MAWIVIPPAEIWKSSQEFIRRQQQKKITGRCYTVIPDFFSSPGSCIQTVLYQSPYLRPSCLYFIVFKYLCCWSPAPTTLPTRDRNDWGVLATNGRFPGNVPSEMWPRFSLHSFPFWYQWDKHVNCRSPEACYLNVLDARALSLYFLGFSWRGSLGWGGETLPGKENLGQEPRNLGDQKRKIIRHRAFSPLAENLPEAEESLPGGLIPSGWASQEQQEALITRKQISRGKAQNSCSLGTWRLVPWLVISSPFYGWRIDHRCSNCLTYSLLFSRNRPCLPTAPSLSSGA